jgi:acetyl esterase/lipase
MHKDERMRQVILLVVFLFSALNLSAQVTFKSTGRVQTHPDVVYRTVDKKDVKMDIALPVEGKGPYPCVVCIHGGAWRLGSRKDLGEMTKLLAERGYVAATIQYRLIPGSAWPAQIEDCKTAVRFLRENAEKYQIDTKRIGAAGFSAGGHLVALLGLTDSSHGFDGPDYPKQASTVSAIVNFFGPADLTKYAKDDSAVNGIFKPMLGGTFEEKPEAYRNASPITYVRKDCPPILCIHGTKDRIVPYEQSVELVKKLKEKGADATLLEVTGADHGWGGQEAVRTTKAMLDFFQQHLKPGN